MTATGLRCLGTATNTIQDIVGWIGIEEESIALILDFIHNFAALDTAMQCQLLGHGHARPA